MRGYKSDIWDGGHRIPFIVRWPAVVKPDTTCAQLTCLTDLMATVADILGAKVPDSAAEDSSSILPLLRGIDQPVRNSVVHHSINGNFAIRQGPWKLVFLTKGTKELYNLDSDLSETRNLAAEQPEIVIRLTGLMQRYIDTGRSTAGALQKNESFISLKGGRKGGSSTPK